MNVTIDRSRWTRGLSDRGLVTPDGRNFLGWLCHFVDIPDVALRGTPTLRSLPAEHVRRLHLIGLVDPAGHETAITERIRRTNMATFVPDDDREVQLRNLAASTGFIVGFE